MITRPKLYVWLFWLIDIVALSLCWRLMPTTLSQIVLAISLCILLVFSLFEINEPLHLGTFTFAVLLINYLQVTHDFYPILVSALIGLVVLMLGCVSDEGVLRPRLSTKPLINWLCLAFLVAQSQAVLSFWPISLFSRTLLLLVVFYGLWQMFRFEPESTKLTRVLHFAYVSVTAIVIIGTIIWANFPQLIPF